MEIEVDQTDFYEGIQIVKQAVSSSANMPILSGVLLSTKEDELKLVGTDLEIGIETFIDVNVKQPGEIVLPAQTLTRIVRELPSEKVVLTTNPDNNTAQINCSNSRFNIHGSEAEEFPALPELGDGVKFSLKQEMFKELVEQTEFSVSQDESKPFLTGGLLELGDKTMKLVATDTYRLAFRAEGVEAIEAEGKQVIIPHQTLSSVKKLLIPKEDEKIEILITDNQALFTFSGITVVSRLIEGEFPDYNQVIPNNNPTKLTADTGGLIQALKRAALLAKEDSDTVKFNLKENKLVITSNAPEVGQAYEEVDVEIEGKEIEFAFNADYMIDCLKTISSEQVSLEFEDALSPGVVKPKSDTEYVYVIMPVRSA